MARLDVETILSSLETILKTYLNAKITSINEEKADGIVLAQIDEAKGYYLQTLDAEQVSANPFVFYGIEDIQSQGLGPETLNNYTLGITIILEDSGQDLNVAKRMFRYSRALQETLQEHWSDIRGSVKTVIASLVPIEFKALNATNISRAVGVQLTVAI